MRAGQTTAAWGQRKVRAPQGRVPGNTWAARADGKCHRKYTAGEWGQSKILRILL